MEVKFKYSVGKKNHLRNLFRNGNLRALVIFAIFAIGVGPLIADQLDSSGNSSTLSDTSTVTSSVESSVTPSPTATEESAAPISDNESTTAGSTSVPAPAPSPTKIPPHAVSNQEMLLQLPRVSRVDPRAKLVNLPAVNFAAYGSPYLMLCMNSSRGLIDVQAKGIDDSFNGEDVFLENDRSAGVRISGTSSQVVNIFNSFGGLRLSSLDGKGIVGTYLFLRFVAISEPTDNFALCTESKTSGQWGIEIQPLGLQINTKKNPLSLGNKK